ncbi:MAG: hypothetical protein ACTSWN_08485, partial [Promethearchaeota archaeon]
IAVRMNNYSEVQSKYTLALELAQSNEDIINPDERISIQEEFADAFIKLGDDENAIRQYTLLYNYLELKRPEADSKKIDILIKLTMIFINRPDFETLEYEIKSNFKKIKQFAEKHKDKMILAKYYYTTGLYELKRNKVSNAVISFRRGVEISQELGIVDLILENLIELIRIYLYGKKRSMQTAFKLLEQANLLAGQTDDLIKELTVYELFHDFYSQIDDLENAAYFAKNIENLRHALKTRGLL